MNSQSENFKNVDEFLRNKEREMLSFLQRNLSNPNSNKQIASPPVENKEVSLKEQERIKRENDKYQKLGAQLIEKIENKR